MRKLKTYESFNETESIEDEVYFIMCDLNEQLGYKVEISFWVNGAGGGFLRSDEWGKQKYGLIKNDGKLFLEVEIKKTPINWIEAKPYFDRLKIFLEKHSSIKYKMHTMRFDNDRYVLPCEFDYVPKKYTRKEFTDTLTSVSYFFERL